MSKHYTQSTAALKTVTLDTTKLDAQSIFVYPRTGTRDTRENILDIIDDVKDIAEQAANVGYLDAREKIFENDVWSSTISDSVDENGKRIIKHNNNEIILTEETILNDASIIHSNKAYFGELNENFRSDNYINVETDKIVGVEEGNWLPVACVLNEGGFNNLKYYIGTQSSKSIDADVLFADFPNLSYNGYSFYDVKNDNETISVRAKLPKLKLDTYGFASSDISHFSGDMSSMLYSMYSFSDCKSLSIFEGDLSSLLIGQAMFASSETLSDFRGNLSNLMVGDLMFSLTSLSLDSVRFIANSLPKIDKTLNHNFEFAIYTPTGLINTHFNLSKGELKMNETSYPIGNISISWQDIDSLSEEEKAIILYDLFPIITSKGWTIDTNLTTEVNEASTIDIEENYYKKLPIPSTGILAGVITSTATHRDGNGNLYVIMESKSVINNDGYWQTFENKEMAAQHWGLEAI